MTTQPTPACPPSCLAHPEHIYILCYGQPTRVGDGDHTYPDPTGTGLITPLITHYVGYTQQQPPVKRIRGHGARSAHFIAQIRPGTTKDEHRIKTAETCPACGESLWYYAPEDPRP